MNEYPHSPKSQRPSTDIGTTKQRRSVVLGYAFIVGCAVLMCVALYAAIAVNPLPRDDELIAHFETHRSEFESLVGNYRNYDWSHAGIPPREWDASPSVQLQMRKIGIARIIGYGGIWLPNPYSIETAKRIASQIEAKQGKAIFQASGAVKLVLLDQRAYLISFLHGVFEKGYYHVPEAPEIFQGQIKSPVDERGKISFEGRVLPSLDPAPWDWNKGECAYRKLDAKWFIYLCRAWA